MRQIVLDTETTGLSTAQGHRIIEIGCLELVNRRLTGREYHRFLNPQRDIDEGAERVHGISRADLEGQPLFADIAEEFLEQHAIDLRKNPTTRYRLLHACEAAKQELSEAVGSIPYELLTAISQRVNRVVCRK